MRIVEVGIIHPDRGGGALWWEMVSFCPCTLILSALFFFKPSRIFGAEKAKGKAPPLSYSYHYVK